MLAVQRRRRLDAQVEPVTGRLHTEPAPLRARGVGHVEVHFTLSTLITPSNWSAGQTKMADVVEVAIDAQTHPYVAAVDLEMDVARAGDRIEEDRALEQRDVLGIEPVERAQVDALARFDRRA